MFRGVANEYANIQKKLPVPVKSIAPTFPQTPPWSWSIPIIKTDFSKWTKELTTIDYIQKKFAELNNVAYKNHFQIFVDGFKMNEEVSSGEFFPTHNITLGERLHDNSSLMSADLNAIIMALDFLMVNEYMNVNIKNIIIYSDSLSSLELLSSASQYKMDIETFLCLRIIDILASKGILTHLEYIPSNALNIDQPSGRQIPIRDTYRWGLTEVLINNKNPTLSPFPSKHLSKIYHRIRSGSIGQNFQVFSYQLPNSSGEVPSSPPPLQVM